MNEHEELCKAYVEGKLSFEEFSEQAKKVSVFPGRDQHG